MLLVREKSITRRNNFSFVENIKRDIFFLFVRATRVAPRVGAATVANIE